ncbi:hypothetical protein MAE02_65040 [Microvirga aerophila]|uniref:Uncharacterized protein n=1 Tax=Microvirga aerophila TaxID=670291 RepID=A0A512C3M8_9HYPH|nr:hypothetical protein MAE02_65040 [Microvirga aerophila]
MQTYPADPARALVATLREQLELTTRQAGDDHFVIGRVFVGSASFRVDNIGNVEDTDLVYILGHDENHNEFRLIQHCTQVTISFTAVPMSALASEDESRPIGFLTK